MNIEADKRIESHDDHLLAPFFESAAKNCIRNGSQTVISSGCSQAPTVEDMTQLNWYGRGFDPQNIDRQSVRLWFCSLAKARSTKK